MISSGAPRSEVNILTGSSDEDTLINESIKRILLISGLHKIVDIYDNLCDAVRKQNKRGM